MANAPRCGIVIPWLESVSSQEMASREEEAIGLASAIALEVVFIRAFHVKAPRPTTLLQKGQFESISELAAGKSLDVIVVDQQLTPTQQRNLEKAWECKVIDRPALIIEIFGERARTKEGKLQVQLALLSYQKSRLVRSWTHLERQRGGAGFMGGPGEKQIESDRRIIQDQIVKIKKQLDTVVKTRRLQRQKRQTIPYPIVALAGYTNAGKSTLFNRLTDAGVYVKDQLFATLDPTMRALQLPSGTRIILSDTVGFVSNLPTALIAAFRATLEEVIEADIILHIRDIANPRTEAQKTDVLHILRELLGTAYDEARIIEVWNKIDLLGPEAIPENQLAVSARDGTGCDELLATIDRELMLALGYRQTSVTLPLADGRRLAWLHEHAVVLDSKENGGELQLTITISDENLGRFHRLGDQ